MKNKILWLSILGLALARPPNPVDSTASNFGDQQKQRTSRSIWPFTSSATTTETPENYPPPLPENEWLVQGETPLPQGIDYSKYPVWKVHKYNGIDLHPVNLQPENTYPPEFQQVDPGYSPDFSQNGYQDFGTHATGYPAAYSSPPAAHPTQQETYQTGESHSSSFTPDTSPLNIQTQQKYEFYALPQPLKDFRSTAVPVIPEPQRIPPASYGLQNTYHPGNTNYQGNNQEEVKVVFGAGEEPSQSTNGNNPDLSFLDDLGGLAPFLPEPTGDEESVREEESEPQQQGFFEKLFSRFRGTTETPETDDVIIEDEKPVSSGGFLSSVFGLQSDSQSSETESSATESSGSAFSSLFYRPETEKPAAVVPTTYYLPKTRGSYVTIKLPKHVVSRFTPSVGPHDDASGVPFTQYEIPHVSSPSLDSGYPYNLGNSEVRNSGFTGSALTPDYQPSLVYGQPLPHSSKIIPQFSQNHGSYHQSDFGVDKFSSDQGAAPDRPRAEYLHSANNDQHTSLPTLPSQPSAATTYRQGQLNSQDSQRPGIHQRPSTVVMSQSEDELPRSYQSTRTSTTADELDQYHNEKRNQKLSNQEHQRESFDTTISNLQGTPKTQDTFDHNPESFFSGKTANKNEPISAPQVSEGFVPSLTYGLPIDGGDQLNFNTNYHENSHQTTSASEDDVYHHSLDNTGDTLAQNFDTNSVFNHELVLPVQSSEAVYRTPESELQNPSNTIELTDYEFLPVKNANDFRETSFDQDDGDSRFIKKLSALTAYGLPTNSYNANSFVAASSNVRSVVVPPPTKDEVNDGENISVNKDVFRSTLPEQLPTKKVARAVRKVMKRRNSVESYHSRRSAPERQAPTEEADTSLIIRSENDSIPEVRSGRQFDGTEVIGGYSKVEHKPHQFIPDTAGAMKSAYSVPEDVQE